MATFNKLSSINDDYSTQYKIECLKEELPFAIERMFNPHIFMNKEGQLVFEVTNDTTISLSIDETLLYLPKNFGFLRYDIIKASCCTIDLNENCSSFLPSTIVTCYTKVTSSSMQLLKNINLQYENKSKFPNIDIEVNNDTFDFTLLQILHDKIKKSLSYKIYLNDFKQNFATNVDVICKIKQSINHLMFKNWDEPLWDTHKWERLSYIIDDFLDHQDNNRFIDEIIDAGLEDWL